ncbi:MAG: WS/DGAT domain-containing protein [Mycolicibacterium neoaurum]|uniref:WS/DGAT domain-containing protein n=1 Tax=Mycolicibacterium neoaurum TaxID=1795 RepID=UPI002FFC259F
MNHPGAAHSDSHDGAHSDPELVPYVGVIAIMTGPMPAHDELAAALDQRLGRSVDLLAAELAAPGDDDALFAFVTQAIRPCPKPGPQWRCWAVAALSDDRWAVLLAARHDIADAGTVTDVLAGLSTDGAVPGPVGAPHPSTRAPGRPTSFSAVQVALADAESVCRTFDVTLNELALTAVTNGLRSALRHRGRDPRRISVHTRQPLSARAVAAAARMSRRIPVLRRALPVEEPDVLRQLQNVHRTVADFKADARHRSPWSVPSPALLPVELARRAFTMVTAPPRDDLLVAMTNVTGPRRPGDMLGRPIVAMVGVPPVPPPGQVAVMLLTYGPDLFFGLTADCDTFPEADDVTHGMARTVEHLAAAARHPHPGRPALALIGPRATGDHLLGERNTDDRAG